ncbi:glycosyltransferase [Thermodesulfobacteriota bacterium]
MSQIPHGPLDFHIQNDIDRGIVRKELGFCPRDRVILMFGAIRPYKGIDTALMAFSKIVKKVPEARLVIVGKLWEDWGSYDRLIRYLKIEDYVKTFLKYIPAEKVGHFFSASDLVILPYHHFDSQSGVGATALAFRKPMIVTKTGGLPELVSDQFYIVPPGDSKALAEKIICCLKDPSRLLSMSEETDKIANKISWQTIALKTLSIYRRVILEKRSTGKKQSWGM